MVPLDVVPFAMLVADGSGAVRTVNQAWIELSGLDTRASLGTGWLATVTEGDRTALQEAIHRVVSGFGPVRCRGRWNGSDRGVSWRFVAVQRAGDILVGIGVDVEPAAVAAPAPQVAAAPLLAAPVVAPPAAEHPAPVEPEPPVRAEPIVAEPAAVLRLVTEPVHADPAADDPLPSAVHDLFRSLDALLATIDRLAERLLIQEAAELEPLPA